jgi:hypothetical protein
MLKAANALREAEALGMHYNFLSTTNMPAS